MKKELRFTNRRLKKVLTDLGYKRADIKQYVYVCENGREIKHVVNEDYYTDIKYHYVNDMLKMMEHECYTKLTIYAEMNDLEMVEYRICEMMN